MEGVYASPALGLTPVKWFLYNRELTVDSLKVERCGWLVACGLPTVIEWKVIEKPVILASLLNTHSTPLQNKWPGHEEQGTKGYRMSCKTMTEITNTYSQKTNQFRCAQKEFNPHSSYWKEPSTYNEVSKWKPSDSQTEMNTVKAKYCSSIVRHLF